MKPYFYIPADVTKPMEFIQSADTHTFNTFNDIIDCKIGTFTVTRLIGDAKYDVWTDDEGWINGSSPNRRALAFVQANIYGDILIMTHDSEGNAQGLPPEFLVAVLAQLSDGEIVDSTKVVRLDAP